MDSGELDALNTCLDLCSRLKRNMNHDAETMEYSIHGLLLETYRETIAEAVKRLDQAEIQLNAMRRDITVLTRGKE